MKKSFLLFCVGAVIIAGSSGSAMAQLVPQYIEDAFKKAALPADGKGKWVVRADVNIHRPNGTTIAGSGYLDLKGNVLAGDLALKESTGGFFIKGAAMYINILKSEPITVRIRHDVGGKPWLGRPAEVASLKNLYTTPFSTGKIKWDGEDCQVSIYLTPEQITDGKLEIREPPKKPIGARYQITGRVSITNTEDGLADNTCEIYGSVMLIRIRNETGQKVSENFRVLFDIVPQDVKNGMVFKFQNNLFFDVYDDDQSQYRIGGNFFDHDTDSGNDNMWPDPQNAMRFNFRTMPGKGEFTYPGDRDSENAEVYITVTKVSDLYKKP